MLDSLFNPKSVLVIGSSRIRTEQGMVRPHVFERVSKNLSGFEGHVFITDIEAESPEFPKADLAVIILPPQKTIEILRKIHAKACIIIPGGFSDKELGHLLSIAKKKKIRLLGPNSICGVINTYNNLNTTFEQNLGLKEGGISFLFQSGGVGAGLLDFLTGYKISFSKFCWVGDMADIDDSELIEYLDKDKNTDVIAVYLEGLKNPRKFMTIAKKSKKPIIVLKGGLSEKTKERILSHTAAIASEPGLYSGMFRQAGIIEVDSLYELIDISMLLEQFNFVKSIKKKDKNNYKIAIVSNTGGMAVLTADHITRARLKLADFSQITKKSVKKAFPKLGPINPLDIIADADGERYKEIIEILLKDNSVDCIIVIAQLKSCLLKAEELNILNGMEAKKPILFCTPGKQDFEKVSSVLRAKFPVYDNPERIARALMHVLRI